MKVLAALTSVAAIVVALSAQEPLPRFRSGANLVTVDAYISKDGAAITDLKQDEIEVLEDNTPQVIEGFRLIRSAQGPRSSRGAKESNAIAPGNDQSLSSRTFVTGFGA